MRALLDVNVLIALFDPDHVHHARAWRWFKKQGRHGWATCPITQNGCIRIMSQPGYPNPLPTGAVIERMKKATSVDEHEFWPDELSLLDSQRYDHSRIHGHRQLTDLYLLGLAVANEGCLASFEQTIALSAVRHAQACHLVLV